MSALGSTLTIISITHLLFLPIKSQPVVELPLGKVSGSVLESVSGRNFFSFQGIPYAQPPTGIYRFEEPLPVEPWNGILIANKVYKCLQYRHLSEPKTENPVVGLEDCLFLNIYTPTLNTDDGLDVIIFIHGGAFMFNYGGFQGPEILLDHDVVYVTLNYRLGPLGFLSTEDDVVPGNNGLKDQILAFQFIQKYIQYFGGNPRSITISGNSAGGGSVHLHCMINKSLFHRAISQSGTALNPWVIAENPLEKTLKIAETLGCPTGSTRETIDCLKKQPGEKIVETTPDFQPWLFNPFSPFAVVVDSWAKDPLIPEHPYQLLKKKLVHNVPWVASYVQSEGLYPAAEFYSNEEHLDDIDKKWEEIVPYILHYNETVNHRGLHQISSKIREYYFGDNPVNRKTYGHLVEMIGDRLFVVGIHQAAKLHAQASASPTYLYKFKYRGVHSRSERRAKSTKNFGAAHGDDASYILSMDLDTRSNEEDTAMSDLMVKMWLSIADTGMPNSSIKEWTPVPRDSNKMKYLIIYSPTERFMEEKEDVGNSEFWDSLPFSENEKLFDEKHYKIEL